MQREQTIKTIVSNRFITLNKIVPSLFFVRYICGIFLYAFLAPTVCVSVAVLGGIFYANVIVFVVVVAIVFIVIV